MVEQWLTFAIAAMLFAGIAPVIHRKITRRYDWLSYAFLLNIGPGVIFLLFSVNNFSVPSDPFVLFVTAVVVVLSTVGAATAMKAAELMEASERITLKRLDILFVLVFAYIFLAEQMTQNKLLGAALLFAGTILISYDKGRRFGRINDLGNRLTVLFAPIAAIAIIIDKFALGYWNIVNYSVMIFFIPGLILGALLLKARRKSKLKILMKSQYSMLAIVITMTTAFFYLRMLAVSLTEASNVFLILRLSTLVTVLMGIILLHEHQRIWTKIVSAIIMIAGASLIAA